MAVFLAQSVDLSKKADIIRILHYEKCDDYITYSVQVTIGPAVWIVQHRYKDFLEFDRARFKALKESLLPPKKFVKNQTSEFLDQRQTELETYLRTVFELEVCLQRRPGAQSMPRLFAHFLDFNKYEVHAIVEDLAEELFSIGEEELAGLGYHEFTPLQLWAISERLKLAEPTCASGSDKQFDFGHVIDFVHRVTNVKVDGTSHRIGSSNIHANALPFSLHYLRSVRRLLLKNVAIADRICGWESSRIHETITNLFVHGSLQNLKDLLDQVGADWPILKQADFSSNTIRTIDASVRFLRGVESLSFANNQLSEIDHVQHLPALVDLDLSGNRFDQIRDWHLRLGNLKWLNLAGNRVSTLQGLSKLFSLEYLDVRNNCIVQVTDVWPIGRLPCLESLELGGNPVESSIEYRSRVLEAFGDRAAEIKLDGSKPSQLELDTVGVRLAIRKAKDERSKILRRAQEELSRTLDLRVESKIDELSAGAANAEAVNEIAGSLPASFRH